MTGRALSFDSGEFNVFVRPLLPSTACVALGIGSGVFWRGYFYPILFLTTGLGLVIGWLVWRRQPCFLMPFLFCIAAGYISVQPWVNPALPPHHITHYVNQGKCEVEGILIGQVSEKQNRSRFIIRTRQLNKSQQLLPVTGNISVSTRGAIPNLHPGDRVWVTGHLRPIRSFCNPGGFDYVRFMAFKGVHASLFAAPETIRSQNSPSGMRRWLDGVRRKITVEMAFALQNSSKDTLAILMALTLGERQGIRPELQEAFNRAGVSHVLAISGLHVGMVATPAYGLGFWLAARVGFLRRRGWTRRAAALFALAPVWSYGLLSGFSASTQRAVLMTVVFLISYWVGRRHNWPNTLAAAALVILVLFPPALLSISFQLSFGAVLTIILGTRSPSPHMQTDQKPFWRRLPGKAAGLMRVSILAIMGTLPLVMVSFDQISWLGPVSNLLVVPIVGIAVVPAGLLGIILMPISGALATICWKTSALGLQPVLWAVAAVSNLPFSAITTIIPTQWEIFLYYLLLILLLTWKHHPDRLRVPALIIISLLGTVDAAYWVRQRYFHKELTVTALDVGQGSAHLLQLPGGFIVMIDGGGYSDNSVFDIGRSVVAPLLRRRKILSIDLVVLSHPNSDHLNGLLYLLDQFSIGEIWSNHESVETLGYARWLGAIERHGISHPPYSGLAQEKKINGVMFEVLAPPRDFMQRTEDKSWRDPNNNSLVVRVSLGEISFLFCGDMMAAAEKDLLVRFGDAKLCSTVLMVSHHGSRSSSTSDFIRAVQASEHIISVGLHNRFGFPHADVLRRLAGDGGRTWRTDLCGAIQITTNGRWYTLNTYQPNCPVQVSP